MDRLIYTAVSGINASQTRLRVLASNMANAQTTGFRAEVIEATPTTLEGPQLEVRALTSTQVKGADMREGALVRTGRDLDVALAGDTLLAVQAGDGSEAYTRRGDLSVSATGVLENGEGLPVIGEGGPVTVPLGTAITIAPDGAVLSANPATPNQPPVEIARLKLANWRGSAIEKGLDGLFRASGGGILPADADARLETGALEQSNVNTAEILTEMIEAQRLFDMRTRLVSTARDLDEGGASLMRLNP